MLATLIDKPFDKAGWIYEIKWDGYRAVAMLNKGKVDLISRNNKSFNDKFYPITAALKKWKINAVVDGEVAVLNDHGVAHFGSLQNWRSEADGQLIYYVFDILYLNGYDLKQLPLTERRKILKKQLPAEGVIRLSENFETTATEFLASASAWVWKGSWRKERIASIQEGDRSKQWLKIKANKRHEVVIGGYTQNEGSVKTFSSLLVGVYDNGELHYRERSGQGLMTKPKKRSYQK